MGTIALVVLGLWILGHIFHVIGLKPKERYEVVTDGEAWFAFLILPFVMDMMLFAAIAMGIIWLFCKTLGLPLPQESAEASVLK
jgi:hypothetical protein